MLFTHVHADYFEQIDCQGWFFFEIIMKSWEFYGVNFGGTLSDGVKDINWIFFEKWEFTDDTSFSCQAQREDVTAFGEFCNKNLSATHEEEIFCVVAFMKEIFSGFECEDFSGDFVELSNHRFHDFTFRKIYTPCSFMIL